MKEHILRVLILQIIITSMLYASPDSLSTDYPFLRQIRINCAVSYTASTGIYSFVYSLTNDILNKGDVWNIDIDITRNATSLMLDTTGLRFYRPYMERSFRRNYAAYINWIVPVCGTNLPNRKWDASILSGSTISISVLTLHPKPGKSVSGIELTSKGLPGIRRLTVVPYFDETIFFPGMDDTVNYMTYEQKDSIYSIVNYYGWTVGPYAPQAIFNPQTILDTLTSYTTQSRALGWINDQPTADKYLGYYSTAKTSLQQNNISLTRTTLQQVLTDVNVDNTTNPATQTAGKLTSEAYALLRFNTEYLLDYLIFKLDSLQGSFINSYSVKLHWTVLTWTDIPPNGGGYNVYRAISYEGISPSFNKLNSSLLPIASYKDIPEIHGTIPTGIEQLTNYILNHDIQRNNERPEINDGFNEEH